MDEQPRIQVISASIREGRFGETVGCWFYNIAKSNPGIQTEFIDLRDWPLPLFQEPKPPSTGHRAPEAAAWSEKIARGDGYIVVTPEYNHAPPPALKNAIDHLHSEWTYKPIGFVSYGGGAGGARSVEILRMIVINLNMVPIREAVTIPMARRSFDEAGRPIESALNDRANALLDQMSWWASVLRNARAGKL